MASFDIITTVGLAYRKTWEEKSYLFKMAIIPFMVKLGCFVVLASVQDTASLWMTGIILLPSFIIEGWFLTHWARTVMTGGVHRWPFRATGDDKKDTLEIVARGRGIMSGTVAFALINFLIAGYFAFLFSNVPDIATEFDPQDPDPRIAVAGSVFMISSLFLFRYVWLYIPLAVNLPVPLMLKKLKPMSLTFKMIGLWLICVIPAILVLQILGEGMFSISAEENNAVSKTGFMVLRIIVDMVKNLICTAGMAMAFMQILKVSKA